MKTCHRSHLEARCVERGYTLAEVMPCVVSQEGDEWTIDVEHQAYPRVSRLPPPPPAARPGLGDRVHDALAAVGITPYRVAAALGVEDCGCEERRELLNQAGYALGIGAPPPADGQS